eukprot:6174322-Pleurochrysis_carterae.AAC.2
MAYEGNLLFGSGLRMILGALSIERSCNEQHLEWHRLVDLLPMSQAARSIESGRFHQLTTTMSALNSRLQSAQSILSTQ